MTKENAKLELNQILMM